MSLNNGGCRERIDKRGPPLSVMKGVKKSERDDDDEQAHNSEE